MTLHNPTNAGRAEKIKEMLGLLKKSGDANNATAMDYAILLGDVHRMLAALTGGQAQTPAVPTTPGQTGNRWHSITDMVKDLDIKECGLAMSHLVNKIDDYVHEKECDK